ncbi:MAG TPA: hypothetical protein VD927_00060 [Chryseosolibacter sp.]|nr:hypothetical protein [Chryseosolibacter sp.]
MHKKNLYNGILLCGLIIAGLLVAYVIPEFSVGQFSFRKVDILSELKSAPAQLLASDTTLHLSAQDSTRLPQDSIMAVVKPRCPDNITCIEDYSADSTSLKKFLRALSQTRTNSKVLRVAFYGDSFIEGDVFCGSFRDTLQSIFGGRGVGFVPITSSVAGFRNTIKHDFKNWRTWSLISKEPGIEIGPGCFTFHPLESNWVEYKVSRQRYLREFNLVKLYYKASDSATIQYTINEDTTLHIEELKIGETLNEWSHQQPHAKSYKLEFYPAAPVTLFGASFETTSGLYVDNFSLRGNTGLSWRDLNDDWLKAFGEYRKYRLVILQFGLNLLNEKSLNYPAYIKKMIAIIHKMKRAYPTADFLIISVGDRSENVGGTMQTMNTVPKMVDAQREIAKQAGVAFWDMYTAMGGRNSMVKYATSRPPLAAKDYTHLTFKGGKKLAGRLVKSLLYAEMMSKE